MRYKPAIVVVAYNRPRSLERILYSLSKTQKINDVKLIISIDNNEPENLNVKEIAEKYNWPFGKKEVIYRKSRMGLRKHILECGDLSQKYGSVIVLEDDLFVSPYFYDYAVQALEFYENDQHINGISLYRYPYEDMTDLPFIPISDDSDVYFMQFPSSLGQAWSSNHWNNFREWLSKEPVLESIRISPQALSWPETSWKKYFNAFLVDSDTYFVFPRFSLTTNFNDPGTHKEMLINHKGQVSLLLTDRQYKFIEFSASNTKYDAHFELASDTVKKFCPELGEYDFEMDLYGLKLPDLIDTPYVITSKPSKKKIMGFKRALKPHDLNVLMNLKGEELVLCKKEDLLPFKNKYKKTLTDYLYYYDNYLNGIKFSVYYFLFRNRLI